MRAALVNEWLTMVMSKINTFMSDGTFNEDAESPELERGAWPVVAGKQRGRSGDHVGAGTRHLAAASVSVSATRACAQTCDAGWRTVSAGDVQNSPRRARAIACVFQAQRVAAERDCHRGGREARAKRRARPPAVCLEFAFDRLLPIKLQQAYGLLVANCVRPVGQDSEKRGDGREACSDLRQGLVGQTEGRTYHCEPNGSSARLRPTAGLQRAQ